MIATLTAAIAEHGAEASFPLLTGLIAVPALGAVLCALLPRNQEGLIRLVGFLFSIAAAVLTVYIAIDFKAGADGFQLLQSYDWIKDLGV